MQISRLLEFVNNQEIVVVPALVLFVIFTTIATYQIWDRRKDDSIEPVADTALTEEKSAPHTQSEEESDSRIQINDGGQRSNSKPKQTADSTDTPSCEHLIAASQKLEMGDYNQAVQLTYASLKRQFKRELGIQRSGTHHDLYYIGEDSGLSEEELIALKTVVDTFERAAYTENSIQKEKANEVVMSSRQIVDYLESGSK